MSNILLEVLDAGVSLYYSVEITEEEEIVYEFLEKYKWIPTYTISRYLGIPTREIQKRIASMRSKGMPILSSSDGLKIGDYRAEILAYCSGEILKACHHKDTVCREMKAILYNLEDENEPCVPRIPVPPKPWWKIW